EHEHEHEHDKLPHGAEVTHENLHVSHHEFQQPNMNEEIHTININAKPAHWLLQAFDIKANFLALIKTAKEANTDESLEVLGILKVGTVFYVLYANAF